MDFYSLNINKIRDYQIEMIKTRYPKRYWKAMNYHFERDRLRCIGAYILLNDAFPNFNENKILLSEYQKPYFENDLCFNYAHSGDYVVLITDKKSVGIDIEKIKDRDYQSMKEMFTEEEYKWIEEEDSLNRFLTLWCKKESVMKLFGFGLHVSIQDIDVLELNEKTPTLYFDKEVYNRTFVEDGHIISVSSFNKPNF